MKRHFWIFLSILVIAGCGPASPSGDEIRQSRAVDAASTHSSSSESVSMAEPVQGALRLTDTVLKAGDEFELSVTLKIAPLWTIGPLQAAPDAVATQLRLDLPPGLSTAGAWQFSEPFISGMSDGHPGYGGEVVFTRRIRSSRQMHVGAYPIQCKVAYQACNEHQCLRPAEMDLKAFVEIR